MRRKMSTTPSYRKQDDLVNQLSKVTDLSIFKKVKDILESVDKLKNWMAVFIVLVLILTDNVKWIREWMYIYIGLKTLLDASGIVSSVSDVMTRIPNRMYAAFSTFTLKEYIGGSIFIGVISLLDVHQRIDGWRLSEDGWLYVVLYIMVECAIELANIVLAELTALLIFNIAFSDELLKMVEVIAAWIESTHSKWVSSFPSYHIHLSKSNWRAEKITMRFIIEKVEQMIKQIQRHARKEYKQVKKTRIVFWSSCYLFIFFVKPTTHFNN